jgi:drug/metabolite transporter (DMT)-like permease
MKKGYLFVLLTALVSGVSIFLNKFAVSGIDPYIFTFSKNLLVALFLLAMVFMFREFKALKKLTGTQWAKLAAIGLVGGSVPFLLFFKGLSMAPSVTASLLHKSMFLFVAVAAVFFLKERLSKGFFIAAILLFAGNLLLLGKAVMGFGLPELLILVAVLFWSAETIISKHVLEELSSNVVAFGRMFFGVIFIFAFLAFNGGIGNIASFTLPQLGWILFTSVLLLAYVSSWYAGLKLVSATGASCVLVLGSAITTLLSLVFAGPVGLAEVAGAALITSGVLVWLGYSYLASKVNLLLPSKN